MEAFEMWIMVWRRVEISWKDIITNTKVLWRANDKTVYSMQ